jgi:hypothetical protein
VVVFVIFCVVNPVIQKACLPYFVRKTILPFRPKGETALDKLQGLFQRYFRCRCQLQMKVMGRGSRRDVRWTEVEGSRETP